MDRRARRVFEIVVSAKAVLLPVLAHRSPICSTAGATFPGAAYHPVACARADGQRQNQAAWASG